MESHMEKNSSVIKDASGIKRIQSGIHGLDSFIGGGIVAKSSVLLRGDTGTLKTLFSLQFLYTGAHKYDEPGAFLSFADSEETIYQHGKVFGWDIKDLVKKKKLAIIRYHPHEVVRILEDGGGVIRDTLDEIGAKRFVVDSLTEFEMLFESRYKANESILDLFELLRQWNTTSLVTSETHVDPNRGAPDRLGFLTDGIINLYHLRINGEMKRALEIIKMRDTAHSEKIHICKLKHDGISLNDETWSIGEK